MRSPRGTEPCELRPHNRIVRIKQRMPVTVTHRLCGGSGMDLHDPQPFGPCVLTPR